MIRTLRSSRYARNAFANVATVVFVALVGFFLSPFIVRHLGPTNYGVWSLTAGLIGYLGLLDLGIRQAVSRFVAHNNAARAHDESSLIVSAALRLFGFIGVLTIVLAGFLAWATPMLFNVPVALVGEVRTIVILGGLSLAVSLVGGVFGGVVTGIERFDVQGGIEIFVTAIRSAAIVLALKAGHGLVALAVIQLVTAVASCVIYRIAAHRLFPELRIRWRGILVPQMRTILSYSASLTVLYAIGRVISYSDTAVIGAFLPMEAITSFVIAGSLCMYAKEVPRSLSYLMGPRISAMTSVGSAGVGEEILQVARIATLISASIAITFLLRGESFISLWMGPAYGPLSGEVLRILAIVVWLDASRSVIVLSITGMARQRTVIPGLALEAAFNLALSLALVRPLGIAGVALGTVIPGLVVSLGHLPRCLSRTSGVAPGPFRIKAILIPTAACIPFALASYLIERVMPATNLAVFFLQVILILPLVPLTAWFVCLSGTERERAKSEIRKRRAT